MDYQGRFLQFILVVDREDLAQLAMPALLDTDIIQSLTQLARMIPVPLTYSPFSLTSGAVISRLDHV